MLFFLSGGLAIGQTATSDDITVEDLKEDIFFLASDSLKGRYPGTPEDLVAAEYIRKRFRDAGLDLIGEEGMQHFKVVTKVQPGNTNYLNVNGTEFKLEEDFIPMAYSMDDEVQADVVFTGYGFDIDTDSIRWNDYESVDVTGKWALFMEGDPEAAENESIYSDWADTRGKVLTARDKEAAGVLVVTGSKLQEQDALPGVYFDKTRSDAGIPVIHLTREVAHEILKPSGKTLDTLESALAEYREPVSFRIPVTVHAVTDMEHTEVTTYNVFGYLEGSDPLLKEQAVVVGAHYDHLGVGGPGSGSRAIDTTAIHYGADDNASGVAGMLELAEYFSALENRPSRSLLFVAFGAEEMGLIGSEYFVEHSPLPLDSLYAMINFDMIGRLDEEKRSIMVGGAGTSAESEEILRSVEPPSLNIGYSPEGYGPSDHAAFYGRNIPVFFISTGAHTDYHTPYDRPALINYEGQVDVLHYAIGLIGALAERGGFLTFTEAGPKERARRGYRFKVTLGIMPDFTGSEQEGLGVGGVRKDGPADRGGMLKGDVITALDGKPVKNIYDYMNRLKKLEAGQRIAVDVIRDGKKEVLIIQL